MKLVVLYFFQWIILGSGQKGLGKGGPKVFTKGTVSPKSSSTTSTTTMTTSPSVPCPVTKICLTLQPSCRQMQFALPSLEEACKMCEIFIPTTTTTTTTTTPCMDQGFYCQRFGNRFCHFNSYARNCEKTCGLCGSSCVDRAGSRWCRKRTTQRKCSRNRTFRRKCERSCGLCHN